MARPQPHGRYQALILFEARQIFPQILVFQWQREIQPLEKDLSVIVLQCARAILTPER
jgi:hypothetical protein